MVKGVGMVLGVDIHSTIHYFRSSETDVKKKLEIGNVTGYIRWIIK